MDTQHLMDPQYLMGNPTISFFKIQYKRHTNFILALNFYTYKRRQYINSHLLLNQNDYNINLNANY